MAPLRANTDPMSHVKQPRAFLTRGASKYLVLFFALFFLAIQSSTLLHSHSGDLNKHIDCTLCLKIGSSHDALPASTVNLLIPPLRHRFDPVSDTAIVVAQVPAKSRSPPSSSV